MLSYIILCCGLFYVQAYSVEEIIDNTNHLLNETFENCDCGSATSCLCLPRFQTGCELPCFVAGFERMEQTLQVNASVRERIRLGRRLLSQLHRVKKCKQSLLCKKPCDSSSQVNVKEFLTDVQATFQQVNKEKGRKLC